MHTSARTPDHDGPYRALSRRRLLALLAAGVVLPRAALAALRPTDEVAEGVGSARLTRLGIQLYAVRAAARPDMLATLRLLSSIGYREVELLDSMGNLGVAPARMRELLDASGMKAPSTHTTTDALSDLPRLVRDARTLGHQYLVVVSLPIDRKTASIDDYRRWADKLNAIGRVVRREGMWLGFHNEPTDFAPIGGAIPYDAFVEAIDPACVRLQLDTGNAAMGGQDPLRYMTRWADRFWLFHMKDVPSIGAKNDAEIGTGVIDFPAIVKRIGSLEGKHVYLEQEPAAGMTDEGLRRSFRYLSRLGAS